MHSLCVPSVFLATGVLSLNGEYERSIWPAARYLSSCFFSSLSCFGVRRYVRCVGCFAFKISSSLWPVLRCLGRVLWWSSKTCLYFSRSVCISWGIGSFLICLASSSGSNFLEFWGIVEATLRQLLGLLG